MADDAVFQEAVDALHNGEKIRARQLLTGLLKTDQNNATYWIWLSAAMETTKEQVYCLQTAFKLDPENATAKRGLILLGALPADDTIQPFPVNRPRTWEEKLLLAHEKPKLKGWAAVQASPVFRLGLVVLVVGALGSAVVFGFIIPRTNQISRLATWTPGPSPTYTLTVTAVGAKPQTPIAGTPGALSELVEVAYTPTPLYVEPKRSPITDDYYRQFIAAYQVMDWDNAIAALTEVLRLEPDTVYAYYYIGEAYRFKGDVVNAQQYYGGAIDRDANFGAGYVGLARARLLSDPNSNVLPLLDQAIQADPNFGEAYLERARVKTRDNDITGALVDLDKANDILGDLPLVFFYLAQTRLKEGKLDLALNSARRANELDVTMLPNYLLLGQIYTEMESYEEAAQALDIYLKYETDDLSAYVLQGRIQYDNGNYEESIRAMDAVIAVDRRRPDAHLYRFLSNVELARGDAAEEDLRTVLSSYPDLFEVNLAAVRVNLIQKHNGSALLALDQVKILAETDEQKGLYYYWSAVTYEAREEFDKAIENWMLLLDLPTDATTLEMRKVANEHLVDLRPATTTPTPRTPTPTKPVTATPTKTLTPTRTPTRTPTP